MSCVELCEGDFQVFYLLGLSRPSGVVKVVFKYGY